MPSPVVILVRPQMGENIGAVARAMSNFGFSELRLVAPRDGWPNRKAFEMASGGQRVLEHAKLFDNFAAALADIHLAYATTARVRDMEKRVVTPDQAMKEILSFSSPWKGEDQGGGPSPHTPPVIMEGDPHPTLPLSGGGYKVALVFGPERTGLENEEIVRCDTLITIPTAENASLNLGQSVVVLGYEWMRSSGAQGVARELPERAPLADYEGLFDQLESYLDEINYYRVADKKTIMWQNLQNMLLRGGWSGQEVRSFRGMLRGLWERRIRNQD